jgi:nitroreductase/NAD-dependent dihydropyrimidine dehydrogenase PreA subunit
MPENYKLETIIKVDENLCINCGSCIRACPVRLITKNLFPVPIENSWDQCIDCGHCVAICPTEALQQRSMKPEECEPIDIHLIPQWDKVRQYLISRRSIRTFIKKPIGKEKVELLLDISRFAPNGGNQQPLKWIVINDEKKIRNVSEMTIDWMKIAKDRDPSFFEEAKLSRVTEPWELGVDSISRGAPCLIIAYASANDRSAMATAMIAIHQIQLAAPALGLGTTFTGIINTAAKLYAPLMHLLKIPDGCIPFGSSAVGYPAETYLRIPTRKSIEMNWI